jgi:hypothetical protein
MIYDSITQEINNYLGDTYILKYANNHDVNFEEILPKAQEEMKYGVLRVDSGTTTQVGGTSIRVEQLRLIVAIPEDRKVFNEAITNLKTLLQALNDDTVEDVENGVIAKLFFGEYRDASCQIITGNRWWVSEIAFTATFYDGVYDSTSISIQIGNSAASLTTLKGIMTATYRLNKTLDPIVGMLRKQRNAVNNYAKQLTINLLYFKNDSLITDLLNNEETSKKYYIVYNNGIKSRSDTYILASLVESVVMGDVIKAEITFTIGV